MVDGVGASVYTYTYNVAGDLTSEDGPWANDAVSRWRRLQRFALARAVRHGE